MKIPGEIFSILCYRFIPFLHFEEKFGCAALSLCYKFVQGFKVTCLFTGQYNTKGYDMITDVIQLLAGSASCWLDQGKITKAFFDTFSEMKCKSKIWAKKFKVTKVKKIRV